jgi:hypothetical protein
MTEMNSQTEQKEQKQSQGAQSGLAAELNRLGENMGKLLKATWESDERKSIERELKSGLDQFNKQINSAVEQARVDQGMQKARSTLKDAWQTAHGPQMVSELHAGLVDSLKRLNDEIARHAEARPAQEAKPDTPVTPVETDKPADPAVEI